MFGRNVLTVVAVCGVLVLAASAQAAVFDGVQVEAWTGSGANEAVVVIDFGVGKNFAFSYRWDATATGWDALAAIDASGAIDVNATWYDAFQAHLVNDISRTGVTKDDGYSWGYYTSSDGSSWSEYSMGCDARPLSNGAWDGWSWGWIDFETWAHQRSPVTPAVVVPEPITLGLLLVGGAALLRRRHA
ncbi:MAG: PEP-CTERM sorting domain-containing protein [Planctomycetaceae bacterium]|nr:PEP-CTERM sorting domain-containing protein [Planctomycetaceae bacterium]